MGRQYRVIDADAHVNPLPSSWVDYLPAEYRDRAPVIEPGDEVDYVVFEGTRTPFTHSNAQAGMAREERKSHGHLSEVRAGGWDPDERLADMDIDGIDAAVIFGGGPLGSNDPELYVASFHAYNAWLADFCANAPDRLWGVAYIPMFDVDVAVAELRWAHAHGLKGVVIPAYAPVGGYSGGSFNAANVIMYSAPDPSRSYADEEFAPFWAAASELNMPLHVHLGASKPPQHVAMPKGPEWRFVWQTHSKLTMAECIVHFIMSGILPSYPELKLVSVESGVGWFAFTAEYLDNLWHKHRYAEQSPLTIEPSTYWDRQVYGTFLQDAAGIANRHLKGGGNIMWSSDYPHSETTWPNSQDAIKDLATDLGDDERDALISGNARRLYGLD